MTTPFNPYAFPSQPLNGQGEPFQAAHEGMGLRDYFAAKAMAAMITTSGAPALFGLEGAEMAVARAAYKIADAMLRESQS